MSGKRGWLWLALLLLFLFAIRDAGRDTRGDVRLFHDYAALLAGEPVDLAFIQGKHPEEPRWTAAAALPGPWRAYRDLPIEYPAAALPLISLPRLFSHDADGYGSAFALLCALILLGATALALRFGASARDAALAVIALGPIALMRLDAPVGLAVAGAVAAAALERSFLAGVLLGGAASLKVLPAALLPLLAMPSAAVERPWRRPLRVFAGFGASIALLNLPALLFAGWAYVDVFRAHAGRGLQLESSWAALAMLLERLRPGGLAVEFTHGAHHLSGGAAGALLTAARLLGPLLVAGVAGLAAAAVRRVPRSERAPLVLSGSCAVMAALWLGSPVLSPQYLLWGFPLFLLVPGPRGRFLAGGFAVAALLTQLEFPWLYGSLLRFGWGGLLVTLSRDAVLGGLLVYSARR